MKFGIAITEDFEIDLCVESEGQNTMMRLPLEVAEHMAAGLCAAIKLAKERGGKANPENVRHLRPDPPSGA